MVGQYLREWGATVACLQETVLASCDSKDRSQVGRGFLDGFVAVNANGHLGGLWSPGMRTYTPSKDRPNKAGGRSSFGRVSDLHFRDNSTAIGPQNC